MFEWLFNYPLSLWRSGQLSFDSGWPLFLLPLVVMVLAVVIGFSLYRQPVSKRRKLTLFALQSSVAVIVTVMLWQPVLQLEVASEGENTVAWVIDHSHSMQTDDMPSENSPQSRLEAAVQITERYIQESAFSASFGFNSDLYTLAQMDSNTLQRTDSLAALQQLPSAATTPLGDTLDMLLGTVSDSALAAVVLLSDGAGNGDVNAIDAQWWQRLSAAGVPVHTVGLGQQQAPEDLQLSSIRMPEVVPPDTQFTAQVRIAHNAAGQARLRVFAGRDLLAAEDIALPDGVSASVHEIQIPAGERGVRRLQFEVSHASEQTDPEPLNNRQPRVLQVADVPRRVLYVEGEPRWEYKFLRRAMHNHPAVDVVSLLRTSPNKFYRQGVRDGSELADGFPVSREELFVYDAVIIGSLEAVELSQSQQLALRDFVSIRGGTLLMLAGRHGLADGGWGRSVVSAALPVVLDASLSARTFERRRSQARPTLAGWRTPWLQLSGEAQANRTAWLELPELADQQAIGAVKPGAQVLLESVSFEAGAPVPRPLMAVQRYGRGQSLVMGTSGTWRWQMNLDSTDQRHEQFWRQLITMMAEHSVPRIAVEASEAVYRDMPVARVAVTAHARNYEPLQQATLPAQLTLPDGTMQTIQLQADGQKPGRFLATVDTPLDGPYTLTASTSLEGEAGQGSMLSRDHWWVRESDTAERFHNTLQPEFLQRVAEVTGGSYFTAAQADQLANALSVQNAALKREVREPLWNMPILFLGLLLAKMTEWLLRLRWKRL